MKKKITMTIPDLTYAVEEAMNRLRINIKFSGKHTKTILMVSSLPQEGKSTVSVQLWKMLAEAGFPSVLVDADLRRSVLQERLHYECKEEIQGLDYYLSGLGEYEDIVYETNIENGYLVPVSNLLENPSTLLEDARLKVLLQRLEEEYRFVILDSPPLNNVADAALLASLCDGAVLIVRSGVTPRGLIKQSLQQLERTRCKLLGVVLNRMEMKSHAYRKYYGKYGDYYDNRSKEKASDVATT